jgi:hypothetical protein
MARLLPKAGGIHIDLSPYQVAGSYYWQDDNTLILNLRYIESPHTETMICKFKDDEVSLELLDSFFYGSGPLLIKGAVL